MVSNRFHFTVFFLLASVWAFSCRTTPDATVKASADQSGFVRVSGTDFTLNGQKFKFQGTNFYRLALLDRRYSESEIDDIMKQYSDAGIKVLRFWGFSCETPAEWEKEGVTRGGVTQVPILNRKGEQQEEAWVQVDRVLAAAGKHGIKVIYPLVNFEHEYCGMEWWNHVYGNKKESKHGFYCEDNVRKAFKGYVSSLLNRRNTINGLAYKDDPAIMAIELANEPHTKDHYETKGPLDESCKKIADGKPGTIVHHWLKEMSEHVRSIDSQHLISSGEEGYRVNGDTSKHSWIHNGMKGVDFERDIQLPLISFATVHLYPDNSDIPRSDFHSWYVPQVIADRARLAHKYGKPIVLEETGFGELTNENNEYMNKVRKTGYAADRPKWLKEMYTAANAAGYAGTMVWQVVPSDSKGKAYDDDLFTFSFDSVDMKSIRDQVAAITGEAPRSTEIPICRDPNSDKDERGVTDGWGFEDGRSCRVQAVSPATEVPWCRDASSDKDERGVSDGWGFEDGRSCRVRP